MPKDLKVLRQRAAELRAEGVKLNAEIEKLSAIENPSDEDAAKIEKAEVALADWEARATQAAADLHAAEDAARRNAVLSGLRPTVEFRSNEISPARTGGFANLADFARTVQLAGRNDPRSGDAIAKLREAGQLMAAPTNFHNEGGSSDGYMVPPQFREEVYSLMLDDQTAILNAVDSEPTSGNQVTMLRDETTPWGSAGVQASWEAEGAQLSPSRLSTETSDVKLHKLNAFVLATDEILEDAPRLNARLTTQAARAINWKASEAIVNGTGAGQPLGWTRSPAVVTVAKEGSQAADTVVAANVAKMYSRMMPSSLARAVWYINSDVWPQLMTMTLGDQPIWTPPSTGLVGAPGGLLFGRPIIPTEHAATLGDVNDIQFVDPMGYYSPRKAGGIRFADSMHLYFDYGIQAFRWTFRLGGQPYLSAPVAPAKGSATKSHFVVLAARA